MKNDKITMGIFFPFMLLNYLMFKTESVSLLKTKKNPEGKCVHILGILNWCWRGKSVTPSLPVF